MPSVGFPVCSALTNTGPWQRQGREIDGSVEWSSTNKSIATKIGSYSYHFLVLTQYPALLSGSCEDCLDDRPALKPVSPCAEHLCCSELLSWGTKDGSRVRGLCCASSLWSHLAHVQTGPARGHCWVLALLIISHSSVGTVLCLVSFITPPTRFSHLQPSWSSWEQERDVGTRDAPKRGI